MRLFPVCKVRVHSAGGNPGIAWSVEPLNPIDSLPLMRGGEILYAIDDAPEGDMTANLLDLAEGLVEQFATSASDSSQLDSMGMSVLADAMRVLAAAGRIKIIVEGGRRVLARRIPSSGAPRVSEQLNKGQDQDA
jgi:hypothetical protein